LTAFANDIEYIDLTNSELALETEEEYPLVYEFYPYQQEEYPYAGDNLGEIQITEVPFDELFEALSDDVARHLFVPVIDFELHVGTSWQIFAYVYPLETESQVVVWSSSDESVATISADGTVTAIAEGTAILTVQTPDGELAEITTVFVIPAEVFYVEGFEGITPFNALPTGVNMTPGNQTIRVGGTVWFTATASPAGRPFNFQWTSTSTSVATVSRHDLGGVSGQVTGRAPGQTTIRVSTAGQSGTISNFRTVTVQAAAPSAPTNLRASAVTATSLRLDWNAPPQGATRYYVYHNGSRIGSVTSTAANISPLQPGTSNRFTVRAWNSGGTSGHSATLTVNTLANNRTVNISLPGGIARGTGGALSQTVSAGNAISQINLTTSGNFIMPATYTIGSGLTFTRVNDTTARINGTPTGNVTHTVRAPMIPTRAVNISLPGGIMHGTGGALSQTVSAGNAISQINLTTSGNFIMPATYTIGSGLTFTRVNDTTARINGTPTGNVTHTVRAPTIPTRTVTINAGAGMTVSGSPRTVNAGQAIATITVTAHANHTLPATWNIGSGLIYTRTTNTTASITGTPTMSVTATVPSATIATRTVTINPGAGMTVSGSPRTVNAGQAITAITVTANTNHVLPATWAVGNGLTYTRTSNTTATITGTPSQSFTATVPNATISTRTVTINPGAGMTVSGSPRTVNAGQAITAITVTANANHTLPATWAVGNGLTYTRTSNTTATITGTPTQSFTGTVPNATLNIPTTHTVTFITGTSQTIPPVTGVVPGGSLGNRMPADPTPPQNQRFVRWDITTPANGGPFTSTTPVNGNITVTAQWEQTHPGGCTDPNCGLFSQRLSPAQASNVRVRVTDDRIATNVVQAAVNDWASEIVIGLSWATVERGPRSIFPPDTTPTAFVFLDDPGPGRDGAARFAPFGDITNVEIVLRESEWAAWPEARQGRIVRHEIGHMLGLCHPTCGAQAIMSDPIPASVNSITAHDRDALRRRFPQGRFVLEEFDIDVFAQLFSQIISRD